MSKKFVTLLAVGLLAIAPAQGVFLSLASAAEGNWIDNAPQVVVGDIGSPNSDTCFQTTFKIRSHTTLNGFFDPIGRDLFPNVCAISSYLGLIAGSGYLKMGGSEYAYKTINSAGGYTPLSVDPDTGIVFYEQPTPSFGPSTYMSWPDSIAFNSKAELSNTEEVLRMAPGLSYMRDSVGNLIVKMPPKAFSSNGKWFVMYAQTLGLVRVNLQTHQMLLFDTQTYSYDLGFQPSIELAISDDGNTVMRSGIGPFASSTKVYDLSGCQQQPFIQGAANTTPGCRSRTLLQDISVPNPGYVGMNKMVFTTDGKAVRAMADFLRPGNVHEYRNVTVSVSGYQIQNTRYLALGDSFSSGEGIREYIAGTDLHDINMCHTSDLNYSSLAAQTLNIDGSIFHNTACSGARTINYFTVPQYDQTSNFSWLPGEEAQQSYVTQARPDVVTISMIGNDIGFKDKIVQCINPLNDTCFKYKEDRQAVADEIYAHFDALVAMYEHIQRKSNGAKVYVLGYPQLLTSSSQPDCWVNEPFNNDEISMARGMITYLNAVIKAATQYSGVQYIDVESAFDGHQLCDGLFTEKAVNGLAGGDDIGLLGVNVIGNESFHPNKLGNRLMSEALLAQSQNFTLPMPTLSSNVNTGVVIPYVGSASYNAFIGNAPVKGTGYTPGTYVNLKKDDGDAVNIILQDSPTHISDTELKMQPNSNFDAVLHSTPTPVGTVQVDAEGHLSGTITVPSSVQPGFHMLHLTGKDLGGKSVDLYKSVYVAASENDIDGDGVPNSEEKCLGTQPINQDYDRDGIDDACDPEVTQPPADSAPPEVTGTADRDANANGWYNADVTINWTATDPDPSSGAPTQPAATVADQEGVHTYTSDQSCDPLNNCATGSLELKIDKTAPEITYTTSPAATGAGWNNSAVTVAFVCSDATSGVAGCSQPEVVSGADGTYVVTGYVTDNAGNTNSVNVLVSLDATAPTVTQSVSPAANANGWNNSDVTVTPTCEDGLAGILTCSSTVMLSTEGTNQVVESTTEDNAGNTASATSTINIDKTAPVLGVPAWINNPKSLFGTATVTIPATDNLAGVAEAEYYLGDTDPGVGNGATMQVVDDGISVGFNTDFPTGVYKVTVRAKDKAGNWSAPVSDYLVVYNPFGVRMTGKKTLNPSLAGGDILPGLISVNQQDNAKFGFNVRYDEYGQIHPDSDFQFSYATGTKCNKPALAQNCHSFDLNTTSIAWLITQGQNNSTGIFQGVASLKVDGVTSNVTYRLTGLDGERLGLTDQDHLTLKVYTEGTNPNTATPIYQVSAEILRGNIKIRIQ